MNFRVQPKFKTRYRVSDRPRHDRALVRGGGVKSGYRTVGEGLVFLSYRKAGGSGYSLPKVRASRPSGTDLDSNSTVRLTPGVSTTFGDARDPESIFARTPFRAPSNHHKATHQEYRPIAPSPLRWGTYDPHPQPVNLPTPAFRARRKRGSPLLPLTRTPGT
ncbi:MAG: hypothetical protein ACI8QS_003350 [Planctomycetota bacterium]|jgi:hypothetical protein